jgi:hypothetical protein
MKDRIHLLEDIYVDISSTASKSNVKALLSIAKQYIFNTKQEFVFGTATNEFLRFKEKEVLYRTLYCDQKSIKLIFPYERDISRGGGWEIYPIYNKHRFVIQKHPLVFRIKSVYIDNYFAYIKLTTEKPTPKRFVEDLFDYYGYKNAVCKYRKVGDFSVVHLPKEYFTQKHKKDTLETKELVSKVLCEKVILYRNYTQPLIKDCPVSQYLDYKPPQNAQELDISKYSFYDFDLFEEIECLINRFYQKNNQFFIGALTDQNNLYITPASIIASLYLYFSRKDDVPKLFAVTKEKALDVFMYKYKHLLDTKLVNTNKGFLYNKFNVQLYKNAYWDYNLRENVYENPVAEFTTFYVPLKKDLFYEDLLNRLPNSIISPKGEQYEAKIKRFDK